MIKIDIKGKLYAVEGGSGSGKNTLLEALAEKGYKIIRGIPSQNPPENSLLNQESQEILDGARINIHTMKADPLDIFNRYIKIMESQQKEAVDLKKKGMKVFLNRSVISFFAHYSLVGGAKLNEELRKLTEKIYNDFLREINGIIVMEKPIKGVAKEGIAGLQNEESEFINKTVEELNKDKNILYLILNANTMLVSDEVSRIEKFIDGCF